MVVWKCFLFCETQTYIRDIRMRKKGTKIEDPKRRETNESKVKERSEKLSIKINIIVDSFELLLHLEL
jgi:hypothetical protein